MAQHKTKNPMFFRNKINNLSKSKSFQILSLGQRGVGKTVFFAGAYSEILNDSKEFVIESLNSTTQQNVESVLEHISQKGEYPPPSFKVSLFNFGLSKKPVNIKNKSQSKLLYKFTWSDIPGEICNSNNEDEDFQKLVLNSHGCCVFFDADALVKYGEEYIWEVNPIIKQVSAIASIAAQNGFSYPIAIVFTKCDLLGKPPMNILRIEEHVGMLLEQINAMGAVYKSFYSAVKIVGDSSERKLHSTGTGAAVFWLLQELINQNKTKKNKHLSDLNEYLQSLVMPALKLEKSSSIRWNKLGNIGLYVTVALALLVISNSLIQTKKFSVADRVELNESILRQQPNNINSLVDLYNTYLQLGNKKKALTTIERLVKVDEELNPAPQQQNFDWKVNLMRLYMEVGQFDDAKKVQDKILKNNNILNSKVKTKTMNFYDLKAKNK